jgi:uncharacterized protein YprB with RNaseH-like and TPR domain
VSVDLRERLRRVLGPSRAAPVAEADARPASSADHAPTGTPARPGARDHDVHHLVPGAVLEGPLGTCFVAERILTLDHRHGDEALSGFFDVSDQGLGCLARAAVPLDVDRESIVFLDTETTGLAGGTGTYAFMVGLAYFRGDQLILRQFFMRDHAEEPAMLAALAQELARHDAVVTFNGKSFDVPLLLTRYSANRQRPTVPTGVHLDLLHPSRRFWRERLESCTLGTLERAILGHERGPDVPGWMIPELYFQYVRGGRPEAMAAVFEHNRHDILSLVALTCRLGRLLDGPAPATAAPTTAPALVPQVVPTAGSTGVSEALPAVADLFAAARIYEDLGLLEEACSRYEQALTMRRDVALRARVATRLAAISRRVGRHERAVQLWRRLATLGLTGCEPFVELAKHYEHRAHDFDAAIQAVEEALTIVEVQMLRRQAGAVAERRALHHRLARLLAKRDRVRGRDPALLALA